MLKSDLVLLLVLLFMTSILAPSQAATYYVASGQVFGNATNVPAAGVNNRNTNVNGSGFNRGSIQYPFKTVQYAVKQVVAGDTVYVRDGVYYENVWFGLDTNGAVSTTQSGTSSLPINLYAEHLGLAYIRGSDAYAGCIEVKSYNDQVDVGWAGISNPIGYIDIRGFDLQSSGHDGSGVALLWTNNVSVRDCTIHDSGAGGILCKYVDYLLISGNNVYNNCRTSSFNASGISILEVRPLNNYTWPGGYHNTITRNTCYNNWIDPNAYNSFLDQDGTYHKIDHTDGNGIIFDSSHLNISTLIDNNLCYRNGGRGICIDGSFHVDVLNNTCYQNNTDPLVGALGEINMQATTWAEGGLSNPSNSICRYITVRDNICWPMAGKQCLNVENSTVDLTVTNNWFYHTDSTALIGYWTSNAPGFNNPPYRQGWTLSGNYGPSGTTETGVNLVGGDPLFVSPGTSQTANFHLKSYSACRDKSGSHPQYDRDYYARPWNNWYDLGAYEYHP